jgi:integrase
MTGSDGKERGILTTGEVGALFPDDWRSVWPTKEDCSISRLAACTGLRLGEILALKAEQVGECYIRPVGSYYDSTGYRTYLKRDERMVPVSKKLRDELDGYLQKNGDRFLFSGDGGITPVSDRRVKRHLALALERSGLSLQAIRERGLTFTMWRHQFLMALTYMDIPSYQIQRMTGYQPSDFYKAYRHIEHISFSDARKTGESLFEFGASGEGGAV